MTLSSTPDPNKFGDLICFRCGIKLERERREFACPNCGQVHCPFCEVPVFKPCPHRLAHRLGKRWHFAELARQAERVPSLPPHPLLLLHVTDAEKQQAFGKAYEFVRVWYGEDWVSRQPPSALIEKLLYGAARGLIRQAAPGSDTVYFFAPDADAAHREAGEVLRALDDGFARLREIRPERARFIERLCSLPPSASQWDSAGQNVGVPILSFAPGHPRRLLRSQGSDLWVWDLEHDDPPRRLAHPAEQIFTGAAFTPDGRHLVVQTEERHHSGSPPTVRGGLWVWDVARGALLRKRALPPDAPRTVRRSSRHGFLHQGQTLLTVRDTTAYLINLQLGEPSAARAALNADDALTLRHAGNIEAVAIASDGQSFATTQGNHALVWRLRPEDVQPGGPPTGTPK